MKKKIDRKERQTEKKERQDRCKDRKYKDKCRRRVFGKGRGIKKDKQI